MEKKLHKNLFIYGSLLLLVLTSVFVFTARSAAYFTFLQLVLFFLCFVAAAANVCIIHKKENSWSFSWGAVSAAFLFMFFDIIFKLHQKLAALFYVQDTADPSAWADRVNYAYVYLLIIVFVLVPVIAKEIVKSSRVFNYFFAAVIFVIMAVIIQFSALSGLGTTKIFVYLLFRICELAALLLFLCSFVCSAESKLDHGAK